MNNRPAEGQRFRLVAAALLVASGQGCSNRGSVAVGGKCALDESCVTGVCLREARSVGGVAWSQGYCSGNCSKVECPAGRCAEFSDGRKYCLSTCSIPGDCRDGYVCAAGTCVPDCRWGWSCGNVLTCNVSTGECGVPATKPVGEPCTADAECLGGVCIPAQKQDAGTSWVGGSCSQACSLTEGCPAGSVCVTFEDGRSYCALECVDRTACRDGYVCSSAVSACLPDCGLGWSCGSTLVCNTSTGECVDPVVPDAGTVPIDATIGERDAGFSPGGPDAGGRGPGPGGPGGPGALIGIGR
jgi:hypothetical protein